MYGEEERGLSIWFRDGIEDILLAIDEANLDMVSRFDTPEMRIYRQGFAAAISAVATAFGIRYTPSKPQISSLRSQIPDGHAMSVVSLAGSTVVRELEAGPHSGGI